MVGRNDPCPCGSGKKYKKCCLPRDEAVERSSAVPPVESDNLVEDPELARWKEEDRQLIRKGMNCIDRARLNTGKLVKRYWGAEVHKRWQKGELAEQEIQQSSAWLWLDWRRSANSKTFAEQMMSDASLTDQQRQILDSLKASQMSVYQVVRLDPGRGAELENVLEGGRVFIHDRSFFLTAEKWLLLFCRVYAVGPYHFMAGGGYGFPPREKEFIRAYLTRELANHQRKYPGASWGEFLKIRPEVLGRLTAELHKRAEQLPSLRNSDGETLMFCKAYFAVKDPEEFLAALRKQPELEEGGHKENEYEFVWVRRGEDETLSLGRIVLTGSKFMLECNSEERLSRGTEWLQRTADLALMEKEIVDPRSLLKEMAKRRDTPSTLPADESPEALPEVQEYLKQSIERHYEGWVDQPLPALNGQTPRQAARHFAGRQRLVELLRDMEFRDRRQAIHLRYDWNKLRRRLGLAEG